MTSLPWLNCARENQIGKIPIRGRGLFLFFQVSRAFPSITAQVARILVPGPGTARPRTTAPGAKQPGTSHPRPCHASLRPEQLLPGYDSFSCQIVGVSCKFT